ncbi:DUF6445 family protein [Flavivirga abyssicola]|uniref:DUF6445 family protein n=1 Tax=Flavivirga abyssicola TaxID=3063533 RepID=UPI0026DF72B8|nr:DUF6445 family protein [Flavivirga sp. MEBiC07777]WVK12914.1 DUF6445 family protein [Flavivirga sp. MEBiC07777]
MFKIIDDFYDNPDEIRDFALKCTYKKPISAKWNGLRSVEKHTSTKSTLFKIAELLNLENKPNWKQIEISDNFWQRASVGMFNTLYSGEQDTIHFHYFTGRWSGVCYLAPEQFCKGKTALTFFRHKEKDITTVNALGEKDVLSIKKDLENESLWEVIDTVEMKYNRMIVFDGQYFHKASDGFGTSPSNCRLTQLFGFN